MSTNTAIAAVTGPLLGLLVVVMAYCLGIFMSIKCCRPQEDGSQNVTVPHSEILHPQGSDVGIFIVARSEDYLVNINPRPPLIGRHVVNQNQEATVLGLAPAYEAPPTYEECVREGLA